ncbi:MAG TPA: hypothetical protein VJT73_12115 [Polyangiaceae bacterium]|nr:hypothetical protein [Polyangiaceae bacterium]
MNSSDTLTRVIVVVVVLSPVVYWGINSLKLPDHGKPDRAARYDEPAATVTSSGASTVNEPASTVNEEPRPTEITRVPPQGVGTAPTAGSPSVPGVRPTDDEVDGEIAPVYQEWSRASVSPSITAEAVRYFQLESERRRIKARNSDIRCTEQLCRAYFSFDNFGELARLEEIHRPDGFAITTGQPRVTTSAASIVVYWPAAMVTNLGR